MIAKDKLIATHRSILETGQCFDDKVEPSENTDG